MRLITWPVDMLAVHIRGRAPRPVRFRYADENGTETVVKVDRVLQVQERRLCGDRVFHYHCGSGQRTYQIIYVLTENKWELLMEKT